MPGTTFVNMCGGKLGSRVGSGRIRAGADHRAKVIELKLMVGRRRFVGREKRRCPIVAGGIIFHAWPIVPSGR